MRLWATRAVLTMFRAMNALLRDLATRIRSGAIVDADRPGDDNGLGPDGVLHSQTAEQRPSL